MADCLVEFKIIQFYNTFIDKYFIEKKNPTKLGNETEVDLTSKLTGYIKLLQFEIFNLFCLQSQLSGHIHRLVQNSSKKKRKTHTLAL